MLAFPRALLLVLVSSYSFIDYLHNRIHSHIWISVKDNGSKRWMTQPIAMVDCYFHIPGTWNSIGLTYIHYLPHKLFFFCFTSVYASHSIKKFGTHYHLPSLITIHILPYIRLIRSTQIYDSSLKCVLSPLIHCLCLSSGHQHILPGSLQ